MKALAIDSATSCISIAAKNDDKTASITLDIGMHQSEKLVPSIAYVLEQCELKSADLDFTTLCGGPGSFTGLRLGFAALKALELSNNSPIYAIPTLDVYAFPFSEWQGIVLSVVDAKKDCFYISMYKNGKKISEPIDAQPDAILEMLEKNGFAVKCDDSSNGLDYKAKEPLLVCGFDARFFKNTLTKLFPSLSITVFDSCFSQEQELNTNCVNSTTDALFAIANSKFTNGEKPLAPYEGPIYIRKSEAEIKAEEKEALQ